MNLLPGLATLQAGSSRRTLLCSTENPPFGTLLGLPFPLVQRGDPLFPPQLGFFCLNNLVPRLLHPTATILSLWILIDWSG